MNMKSHPMQSSLLAFCLLAVSLTARAQQKLEAIRIGSRIDVTIDGKFFTSYRFAEDEKYPFFFPVNGPSGISTTSMRNGEYPHHSSLFFGCDKVNGGNYWQEGLDRGRIVSTGPVLESASGSQIVVRDSCDWTRPGAPQPLRDTRRIVISAPTPQLRQIDFEVTLEAMEDVVIQKTNHSFFSARMDPDLTPLYGGTMVNADGDSGEKATFGKPSPWLACFGRAMARPPKGLPSFNTRRTRAIPRLGSPATTDFSRPHRCSGPPTTRRRASPKAKDSVSATACSYFPERRNPLALRGNSMNFRRRNWKRPNKPPHDPDKPS